MTSHTKDFPSMGKKPGTKPAAPMHAKVSSPKSRAQFLHDAGLLDAGQVNELEGGKGFPQTVAGQDPTAPTDVVGRTPPADGVIASGGHTADARKLLNEPGSHWKKHSVSSGQELEMKWEFMKLHKTRRFTYYITREDWDHGEPLARKHFEKDPIHLVENDYVPYWGPEADEKLIPANPTIHSFKLPDRKGYHLILAVWDVADTQAAFYNVIDVHFE